MADEPRRSGRATKGQHKNLEPAEVTTPKNKKASTASSSKKSKKSAEPEPEAEDEGGEEDVIRCVCGDTTDEIEGRAYISCDACSVWQHNICMGLPLETEKLPEHYLCEQCKPDDHQELLEAMARGEKPWEDRQHAHDEHVRQERNRKKAGKRKSKGGSRKSGVADVKSEAPPSDASPAPPAPVAPIVPTPTPAPAPAQAAAPAPAPPTPAPVAPIASPSQEAAPAPANNKRKFSEDTAQQPAEERRQSSTSTKRRKSEQQKEDKVDADTALVEIEQLPKERQNVAKRLASTFADGVRDKVTAGSYSLGAGENAESVGRHHASRIEYELYQVYGAPSSSTAYASQFRAIDANMRKNHMLVQRLLDGSLTPHGLATMSSQDMASEELQKQRQQLKEEADKQAVMIRDEDEDKPRVRRTHKGDEYIDDNQDNTHVSVFTSAPVRAREEHEGKPPTPPVADGPAAPATTAAAASPDRMDIDSAADAARRESQQQQFDINSVWAKTHDPEQPQAQPSRRRSSFNKSPQEKGEKHDADVDRMLADDDTEYTPAEANGVVWKGQLVQPGVTSFTANARHAAGCDFSRFMQWHEFLPPTLEIEGRLEAKRADDYLCGLQWSKKSDVSVLAVTPYDNKAAFDQMWEYFANRGRYAVIKKGNGMTDIVKDVYITPVGPGKNLPPHLDLLEFNTLDPQVPERMLIMTFVVNKPSTWDNPSVIEDMDREHGFGSPVNGHNPHAPQFSPRPPQGFTPMQNGHQQHFQPGHMPPNPYTAGPPQPPTFPLASAPQAYPSPVQAPQPFQPQYPPHPNPMVNAILGPLAASPVVVQILAAAGGNVEEHVLHNMRDILTNNPTARDDLGIFQSALAHQQPQQQR